MKRAVVFKLAKGFNQRGKNNYRITANRVDKALLYAYRDRRNRKRENRTSWISQINAATRQFGLPYSQFMDGVQRSNIALNRKMLAELAVTEPFSFQAIANEVKKVDGINWRNTNDNRLTAAHYKRYDPVELPPAFRTQPSVDDIFGFAMKDLESAEKKAEQINADLIKSGKVQLKKVVPKKMHRPRPGSPAAAAAAAAAAAGAVAPPAGEKGKPSSAEKGKK